VLSVQSGIKKGIYAKDIPMKKIILLLLAIACFTSGTALADDDYAPGELLIKFKGVTAPSLISTTLRGVRTSAIKRVRATVLRRSPVSGMEQWKLPAGVSVASAIKQLKSSAQVEYVEPNYRRQLRLIPNDPLFQNQWGLQNTGQTINDSSGAVITGVAGADMGLATAWATQTGSPAVVVAVIDDSVDIHHTDLAANIWVNAGETAGDGIDNDGNGFIDDVNGWDFKNNDNNPSADIGAGEGHGTAVSGCIGAVGNNSIGITGVNWNVSIMPLKFNLDVASEVMAMDYAIAKGAMIVNASFGGFSPSVAEQQAVQRLQNAGILLVAAAGNNNGNNDLVPDFPSGYANTNIISVAASNSSDVLTAWSHYGATSVEIAAPGASIFTTQSANGNLSNSATTGLSFDFIQGTSFSSPYVAGIAALIKAQIPAATFQELKGRIIASATQFTAMQGLISSGGRANAATALVMPAQPVLMIGNVVWNDGGNGMIDPGETATVAIQLDNVWADASAVSATMTALSANLIVNTATVAYPNIISGTSQSGNFSVTASPATGQQLYRFKLDITTAGGPVVTRYYQIGAGALSSGVTLNGTLGKNAQDDYQIFFIDIPAGTANLTVQTSSGQDIDLMLKPNAIPAFDFATYALPQTPAPAGTQLAVTPSGNETINIPNPVAGFYTVTVLNFSQVGNTAFTLTATLTSAAAGVPVPVPASAPAAGGGGGCSIVPGSSFDPSLLMLLLLSSIALVRKRQCKLNSRNMHDSGYSMER